MISTSTGLSKSRAAIALALLVGCAALLVQLLGAQEAAAKSVTYKQKSFSSRARTRSDA